MYIEKLKVLGSLGTHVLLKQGGMQYIKMNNADQTNNHCLKWS